MLLEIKPKEDEPTEDVVAEPVGSGGGQLVYNVRPTRGRANRD